MLARSPPRLRDRVCPGAAAGSDDATPELVAARHGKPYRSVSLCYLISAYTRCVLTPEALDRQRWRLDAVDTIISVELGFDPTLEDLVLCLSFMW